MGGLEPVRSRVRLRLGLSLHPWPEPSSLVRLGAGLRLRAAPQAERQTLCRTLGQLGAGGAGGSR
eukprot:1973652-Alexandrium_andersonii.AAC.1